jgi:hypothetical protein
LQSPDAMFNFIEMALDIGVEHCCLPTRRM